MTAKASLSSLLHLRSQRQRWAHIWRGQETNWRGRTAQPGPSAHGLQTGGSIPGCSRDAFCLDLETFSAVATLPVFQISKENAARATARGAAPRGGGVSDAAGPPSPVPVPSRQAAGAARTAARAKPQRRRPQSSRSFPSVQGKDWKASLIINHFALFFLSA